MAAIYSLYIINKSGGLIYYKVTLLTTVDLKFFLFCFLNDIYLTLNWYPRFMGMLGCYMLIRSHCRMSFSR